MDSTYVLSTEIGLLARARSEQTSKNEQHVGSNPYPKQDFSRAQRAGRVDLGKRPV